MEVVSMYSPLRANMPLGRSVPDVVPHHPHVCQLEALFPQKDTRGRREGAKHPGARTLGGGGAQRGGF